MGLKRFSDRVPDTVAVGPQSNQRGIETTYYSILFGDNFRPQSNQRGIETKYECDNCLDQHAPQSNQRGIETKTPWGWVVQTTPSLNRTSVGLKLLDLMIFAPGTRLPQSNQRGIETDHATELFVRILIASIEPAWD